MLYFSGPGSSAFLYLLTVLFGNPAISVSCMGMLVLSSGIAGAFVRASLAVASRDSGGG